LPGHRNLLSGTFGPNAYLTGTNGGQGATFTDSWPTSASTEIVFTTDYASVLGAGLTNETLSMALSSLTTNLGIAGGGSSGFVTSTAGAVVGTFSDDYGTSTPEPPACC